VATSGAGYRGTVEVAFGHPRFRPMPAAWVPRRARARLCALPPARLAVPPVLLAVSSKVVAGILLSQIR